MADDEPASRPGPGKLTSPLQGVIAMASAGTVIAYVTLRSVYTRFYDPLGVTPEEVGLDQAEVLVRSAGLVVLIAMLCGVVLYLIALSRAFFFLNRALPNFYSWLNTPPAWIRAMMGLTAVAWVTSGFLPRPQPGITVYGPPALLASSLVLAYVRTRGLRRLRPDITAAAGALWRDGRAATRLWRAGFLVGLPLSAVLVLALVWFLAPAYAERVQEGGSVGDWSTAWRAQPAGVQWAHQSPTPDPLAARCIMYLGQANGTTVLYDVDTQSVVRVPTSEVTVVVRTGTERCR